MLARLVSSCINLTLVTCMYIFSCSIVENILDGQKFIILSILEGCSAEVLIFLGNDVAVMRVFWWFLCLIRPGEGKRKPSVGHDTLWCTFAMWRRFLLGIDQIIYTALVGRRTTETMDFSSFYWVDLKFECILVYFIWFEENEFSLQFYYLCPFAVDSDCNFSPIVSLFVFLAGCLVSFV